MARGGRTSSSTWVVFVTTVVIALLIVLPGCARGPYYVPPRERQTIDRKFVEYPANFDLAAAVTGLTAPTSIAIVHDEGPHHGSVLIAESGSGGYRPRIYGFKPDGTYFDVYPSPKRSAIERVPPFRFLRGATELYGPIGGMVVVQGRVYVTHRDKLGRGVVSAFDFDGTRTTIVADLPAQGDYSLTDIVVHPTTGRLYFGLGSATNSAVVGLDNWQVGWVKRRPKFSDIPAVNLKLLGYRFDTKNPIAGIFGGSDIAVTAPFQPFGVSNQTRITKSRNDKPSSALYSVNPNGGDLRVEAHGIRLPRGLGFNEYANLFFTNNGMQLRGTRPVKDDPDTFLKFLPNTWYGFPDFSADLLPISESRFQPPAELIQPFGYPELSTLLDWSASGLPNASAYRESLLFGVFPALSGAAKFDFAPASGPFKELRGSAIVAMDGDRAPFATSGRRLKGPIGYKVVRLDTDMKQARDFVRNTREGPGSRINEKNHDALLERPVDVKFAPDGRLYILDYGRMETRNGKERIKPGTGKLLVLEPIVEHAAPSTAPAR
jgi:glucose/arabinose dehydrogenase